MGELGNAYKVLVGNPEVDLKETGWEDVDWFGSVQGLVADSGKHGKEPLASIKGRKFLYYL
jgi:predicted fused transcriptional regulator/phosphomethylpyrimidine kinase